MKQVSQSVVIVNPWDYLKLLTHLCACARVSHQSEAKPHQNFTDNEEFVRKLIELGHESVLEHASLTLAITTSRGISLELLRHRHTSYLFEPALTQESTRFVGYNEFSVIIPEPFENPNLRGDKDIIQKKELWETGIKNLEQTYLSLKELGAKNDTLRSLLPTCLSTRFYLTANFRELRTICKLRQTTSCHPLMRSLISTLLRELRLRYPILFFDTPETLPI